MWQPGIGGMNHWGRTSIVVILCRSHFHQMINSLLVGFRMGEFKYGMCLPVIGKITQICEMPFIYLHVYLASRYLNVLYKQNCMGLVVLTNKET